MPLRIKCPTGHTLIVPDDRAGRTLRCPRCSEAVVVPGPEQGLGVGSRESGSRGQESGGQALVATVAAPQVVKSKPTVKSSPVVKPKSRALPPPPQPPKMKAEPPPAKSSPAKSSASPPQAKQPSPPLPPPPDKQQFNDLAAEFAAASLPEPPPVAIPAAQPAKPPVAEAAPAAAVPAVAIAPLAQPLAVAELAPEPPPVVVPAPAALAEPELIAPPPVEPAPEPPSPEPPVAEPAVEAAAEHPHEEWAAPPPPIASNKPAPVTVSLAADYAKVLVVYQLAAGLVGAALFSMAPAVWDVIEYVQYLDVVDAPSVARWALVLLLQGVVQLAYAVYLFQLPDWTSVWVVTMYSLFMAAIYAGTLGLVLISGEDGWIVGSAGLQLADKLAGGKAALWCLCMVSLSTMLAFFSGRLSVRWHRAEMLLRGAGV